MQWSVLLAVAAICLTVIYTSLRLFYKVLRYRDIRSTKTLAEIVDLLLTPIYQLEVEVEAKAQLPLSWGTSDPEYQQSRHSLDEFLRQAGWRRQTQLTVDQLADALTDSPLFKTLDSEPLAAVVDAMQAEEIANTGIRCDCFYQSKTGLQQLFVLPSADTSVTLRLLDGGGGAGHYTLGGGSRLLFSPSSLACALSSASSRRDGQPLGYQQAVAAANFRCSLHARLHNGNGGGFWSISHEKLAECLAPWPDARRRLLQQFWSHANDTLLLVLVEWLSLDASKFFETGNGAGGYARMLNGQTEQIAEEVANRSGIEFLELSFYEKKPLYKRLAARLLLEIAGAPLNAGTEPIEAQVTVRFYSASEVLDIGDNYGAFLTLDGGLEAQMRSTHLGNDGEDERRLLPGWVGLVPYFAHSRLPFVVRPQASGVSVALLPQALMDRLFRTPDPGPTEAATGFLLHQLSSQVYQHDLLVRYRRLHRGDCLVRRGDSADTVEIVLSGRLRHSRAEIGRGECLGLAEGLAGVGGETTCWSRDVIAVRESRGISLPLSLARAWVSQRQRLSVLDRALARLCVHELERQRQQRQQQRRLPRHCASRSSLALWQRKGELRLRRRRLRRWWWWRKDSGSDAEDSDISAEEEDEKAALESDEATEDGYGSKTGASFESKGIRQSRMVGFEIDGDRFNRDSLVEQLQACLKAAHGAAARLISEIDVERQFGGRAADQLPEAAMQNWLEEQELAYPTLVLVCSNRVTRWTRLVLGYLDCLVVLCDADALKARDSKGGEEPSDTELVYSQMFDCRVELAVLHPLSLCPVPPGTSLRFLRHRRWWTKRVFHIRWCTARYKAASSKAVLTHQPAPANAAVSSDLARLTRCVTGAGVGLAFGNGGGRWGLSNLGALEALLGAGVAVDMVAGSGLGALVAATWALHHGNMQATRSSIDQHWLRVDSLIGRLRDLTLPLVSSYTGAHLNASLRDLFGAHRQAEDLWLPFVAVSTDLVAAQAVAHCTGTVWRSVRASCGRVGAYPPVWEPRTGRLLLDGVHTNRLPASSLRQRLGARWVLALAMEGKRRLRRGSYLVYGDAVSGLAELLRSWMPLRLTPLAPSAGDIQAALGCLGSTGRQDPEEPPDEEDYENRHAGKPSGGEFENRWRMDQLPRACWCLTVRPDPSYSAEEDCLGNKKDLAAVERWSGYWAARRRLRRLPARVRAAIEGRKWTR